MTWSRSPLGQLRLGPILSYGCNDFTIARGIVVNKSRSPITVTLREMFSSTHEAVISLGRRPRSCQKCPAGISDGACGGCVPENVSTGVSWLAGRSLRVLRHKDRQDGATGDDVMILKIRDSVVVHSISKCPSRTESPQLGAGCAHLKIVDAAQRSNSQYPRLGPRLLPRRDMLIGRLCPMTWVSVESLWHLTLQRFLLHARRRTKWPRRNKSPPKSVDHSCSLLARAVHSESKQGTPDASVS